MRALFALLLVASLSRDAAALKKLTPDDPEYKRVVEQFQKIRGIEKDLEDEKNKLNKTRPPGEKAAIEKNIEKLEEKRNDARGKALWMTMRAWDILSDGQSLPEGTMLKPGVNKGRSVTWLPKLEDHTPKEIIDSHGRKKGVDTFENHRAYTGIDGVTFVFPEAFKDPALLALTLIHEKRHF